MRIRRMAAVVVVAAIGLVGCFTDQINHRVREIDTRGIITTVVGPNP